MENPTYFSSPLGWSSLVVLLLLLAAMLACRVGEAAHPGPMCGFDDPEGLDFDTCSDVHDSEADEPWAWPPSGEGPPADVADDGPWDVPPDWGHDGTAPLRPTWMGNSGFLIQHIDEWQEAEAALNLRPNPPHGKKEMSRKGVATLTDDEDFAPGGMPSSIPSGYVFKTGTLGLGLYKDAPAPPQGANLSASLFANSRSKATPTNRCPSAEF